MNYDQLIENWHAKASNEDYFSKFVFEYLAFIGFLKRKMFMDANRDRDAIQLLKCAGIKYDYFEKIQQKREILQAWDIIKKELEKHPLGNVSSNSDEVEELRWWNCSHTELKRKTKEEHEKINGVIHSLNDWENMVEFWCSIRNNLFHGAKNPQDVRDKLLVENGFKTLHALVEILLNGR